MQYKDTNNYFLTGFTMLGTIIVMLLAVAAVLGLELMVLSLINYQLVVLVLNIVLAPLLYIYFDRSRTNLRASHEFKVVALNYLRSVISLSTLVTVVMVCIYYLMTSIDQVLINFQLIESSLFGYITILIGYFTAISVLTLFISCFSLRDIDRFSTPVIYGLYIIVFAIINYKFVIQSQYLTNQVYTVIHYLSLGIAPILVIISLKQMLTQKPIDTVNQRYNFVTDILVVTLFSVPNVLKSIKNRRIYE